HRAGHGVGPAGHRAIGERRAGFRRQDSIPTAQKQEQRDALKLNTEMTPSMEEKKSPKQLQEEKLANYVTWKDFNLTYEELHAKLIDFYDQMTLKHKETGAELMARLNQRCDRDKIALTNELLNRVEHNEELQDSIQALTCDAADLKEENKLLRATLHELKGTIARHEAFIYAQPDCHWLMTEVRNADLKALRSDVETLKNEPVAYKLKLLEDKMTTFINELAMTKTSFRKSHTELMGNVHDLISSAQHSTTQLIAQGRQEMDAGLRMVGIDVGKLNASMFQCELTVGNITSTLDKAVDSVTGKIGQLEKLTGGGKSSN
ncbi:MAG: hypothetical protein CL798_00560, partial [Chromatiales bacterium]|nr:hypothetical protein [Chromatiales bacterium]